MGVIVIGGGLLENMGGWWMTGEKVMKWKANNGKTDYD